MVGAMLVGATMANHPSPSPDGPSPPGPGPELSSLEERSSSFPGPSSGHSYSGPGPKVFASGPSSGPSSSPDSEHPLEVRSDASSPFSPSPAGSGPKLMSPGPGPSPDSDHPLEVQSDAMSPSPAGPAPENLHPHHHPHPHPHGSDHPLEVRSDKPKYTVWNSEDIWNGRVAAQVHDIQEFRQFEHDNAFTEEDKAKVAEWNALSQEERDRRDFHTAEEQLYADQRARDRESEEQMALLYKNQRDTEAAKAKEKSEMDQLIDEMRDRKPVNPEAEKKAAADAAAQEQLAKTAAEDKIRAEKEKKEAEAKRVSEQEQLKQAEKDAAAKLATEKEELKIAEKQAAAKLTAEKGAAKIEKQNIDAKLTEDKKAAEEEKKLAESKEAEKAAAAKLAAEKKAAKTEKHNVDEKLAEEKKVAEEKLANEKEGKQEEKDAANKLKQEQEAANKLKEQQEAADKEKKAEQLAGHFEKGNKGVSRIAKPKSCSCFEAFSHILGYETKTSGPLDKFRLDIWAVRNRHCIQYCTHPFSKLELDSYRASIKGKLGKFAVPENFPEHLYLEAGTSTGEHQKREENGSGHPGPTIKDEFNSVKADIKELKKAQKALNATKTISKQEGSSTSSHKPDVVKLLSAASAKSLTTAVPKAAPKAIAKAITTPKGANTELHAAYNLWLVEFKKSVVAQRAALKGDRKALMQLNTQFVKTLNEAEKNFLKANEEAAAAAVVDLRKETFKKVADKPKPQQPSLRKGPFGKATIPPALGVKIVKAVKAKAPVHPKNPNTGTPPA
jgi:hypothetical protein